MHLEIERLTETDVGDALKLSTQVGWNQTEADWRRLLELFPETCFDGRIGDDLVATSTLAVYREVGWIGMVLVDEEYRRRGYGSEIFERALEAGLDCGLDVVGLDATDAGRTVYSQYGFERVGRIDRWDGTLEAPSGFGDSGTVRELRSVAEVASFDRRHSGVDRHALLGHLVESEDVIGVCRERHDGISGYAIARPGRIGSQIGPIVASERRDIEVLLAALGERLDGSVVIDALRDERTESLLERFGLDVNRRLHRMTHDEPRAALDGGAVVAATGFEWG